MFQSTAFRTGCMTALLATFLGASLTAGAQQNDVSVREVWARATVPGQKISAAYLQITSASGATLLGAESPAAGKSEVHEMSMENGVMKMRAVSRLELPAGQTVSLKPGGYHIMLMDLKQPLAAGDKLPLRLTVEGKGGKTNVLELSAEVRTPDGKPMEGMDHGHHH